MAQKPTVNRNQRTTNKNMVPDELGPPESPLYCPVRSVVVNSGSVRMGRRDDQHR